MGQQISRIKNLFKYEDGDQITPRMGVSIDEGFGLTQYWDEQQGKVVNTDFTKHPATLYPLPYSSKRGQYILPETQGQQWYYNNPETETAGILDGNGNVKAAYASLFEKTTIDISGATYPALKIKGNLCSAQDLTDKHIYYKSTYRGKPFTCSERIPVQTTVGNAKEVLISLTTEDGSGSNVLSNTNRWVEMTAVLQRAGASISGATFQWQKWTAGAWTNVTSQLGVIEVLSSNKIKVYGAGVDGEEIFRIVATHDGESLYKTQQLTDIADPYYIYDGCSQAGDAVEEGVDVTFHPVVYDRIRQVPDTSNTWSFSYQMLNMVTGAQVGSVATGSSFTVLHTVLDEEKGVSVVISANNE